MECDSGESEDYNADDENTSESVKSTEESSEKGAGMATDADPRMEMFQNETRRDHSRRGSRCNRLSSGYPQMQECE